MKTRSEEDYLRTIYSIYEEQGEGISSVDVAHALGVSKPSVSEMLKKLDRKGFIRAKPYSKIFFTSKGLTEAKRLSHNHRVICVFLKQVLDYESLEEIEEQAHRLEHAFSDKAIRRLDNYLDNPDLCPKGKKIHG